jgi:hypothetical protein
MIRFIGLLYNYNHLLQLSVNLQPNPSPLTAEASVHSASRFTTAYKVSHIATDGQSVTGARHQDLSYGLVFLRRPL